MKIETVQLCKHYGATLAVDDVSFSLDTETQVLALIGPSGGGKSTFLRLIGGLETPTSGRILIDGEPLPTDEESLRHTRQSLGFLFQSFNLFPHLSALDNITLPLTQVHGWSQSDAIDRATEMIERFQLGDHAQKLPHQLSGGQQQRIALARAMSHRPSLLLLDEPTSALDPEMKSEVLDLIAELCEGGQRIILSTHEMGFAKQSAQHVLFLANGRALEDTPSTAFFESPRSEAAQNFLKKVMKW